MPSILETLKDLYASREEEIESWLMQKRLAASPFITSSVDLRHSGQRLVPVDTNLFPAGFHNLSPAARGRAVRFIMQFLNDHHKDAKRLLIIPENHTRNLSYLENLSVLCELWTRAGLEVKLGSLIATDAPIELETPSGKKLTQYPLLRQGDVITLEGGFTPDLILLNNDLTSGSPQILENVSQPVLPPLSLGWYQRKKSAHFTAYRALAQEFGKSFGIDPWLLCAEFLPCGEVNFKERLGLETLAKNIETVLARVAEKYREYGIADEPYVYVKADSGTYGMGIITLTKPEDIFELNKKERNKMQVIKEGAEVHDVLIQEGVPTVDLVDGKPAEPMVYMIDGVPIGGMYRVNGSRDARSNLNASGMEFTGMCDEDESTGCPDKKPVEGCHFRSFGLIAALASLAAAREDY